MMYIYVYLYKKIYQDGSQHKTIKNAFYLRRRSIYEKKIHYKSFVCNNDFEYIDWL